MYVTPIDTVVNVYVHSGRPEGSSNFRPGPNRNRSMKDQAMATELNTGTPAGNQTAWDSLMEMFLAAKAVADKFDEEEFRPLYKKHESIWADFPLKCAEARAASKRWSEITGYDTAADRLDELIDVACDRENALMAYPAPGMQALLWKLEKVFESDDGGHSISCWSMSCPSDG